MCCLVFFARFVRVLQSRCAAVVVLPEGASEVDRLARVVA